MSSPQKPVVIAAELVAACKDTGTRHIVVRGDIPNAPSIRLGPGQTLAGEGDDPSISFAPGVDGLQLSSDNGVRSLHLIVSVDKRAIFNDTGVESLGRIRLQGVTAQGQVQILARDKVRSGHVDVDGLDVIAADARAQNDRPSGFGVKVIQGAFTLWNMQADESFAISAELKGLSVGRPSAPVIGSGIFVSGAGFKGGRLVVRLLETGAVYSEGKIAPGTPDVITGGVFTVYGAAVDLVRNLGPVVTYGVNDMVLDPALSSGLLGTSRTSTQLARDAPSGPARSPTVPVRPTSAVAALR